MHRFSDAHRSRGTLAHEKPLVGDLSEEMDILLQTDSIHRGSCHANRPASCLDGSNGRCHIDPRNKTGRLHSHGLQEHAQCTKPQRCPEALAVSSRLLTEQEISSETEDL